MSGALSNTTPTNRRLAGVASATIDGVAYNVVSFSWSPAAFTRTTMVSMSGIDGYAETPSVSFIELQLRDDRTVSVSAFSRMTDVSVVVNLANGKQVVGHNLVCVNAQEVSAAEATFTARFEGADVYEVGAVS